MEVKEQLKLKELLFIMKQMPKTIKLIFTLERSLFLKLILFSIITGILPIVSLYISQELINSLVTIRKDVSIVITIFLTYLGVSFCAELISQISEYYNGKFQLNIGYKLNYKVMKKSSNLGLKDFENPEIYDKLERVTKEISYKPYQIIQAIITMTTSFVTLLSSIAFLMSWNPKVSLLLLVIPVISLFYFLKIGQQEFFIHWKRAGKERKSWYISYILTHDFSFKELKLYNLKDYLLNKYWDIKKSFIEQDTKILRKKTYLNLIYEIAVQLVGAVIIFVAIMSAFAGKIMVGNVMSYIRSVSLVQNHSQSIMTSIYSIYNSNLYMNQLYEFLELKEEKSQGHKKQIVEPIHSVVFQNVSFMYPNQGEQTLRHINVSLHKGERIAIVGPNGSGKSTFIKLLTGLYEVQQGDILINGISIKELDMDSYMNQIAALFQDFMKYEMTLKENIGFGQVDKLHQTNKMHEVLDIVKADFLKSHSSYQFDTQLGLWFEEGRQLSGGQWQKIALARAYFREASLYILDEPSSALDPIAEKETFDTFFSLSKEKIGIFISHRLVAAKLADRIIVMDKGEIVGIGTHEELLKTCPLYKKMDESENYMNPLEEEGSKWKEALYQG
ncbi:ABC transporter ATP-binding protein [Bacillus spizizenii]|jgi:ATP-binding cassette, subfamily B, bacterial NisT/SpaT|uniref:ABC transporter ATP-binding protein n=1 Tax=Bacillus spizizenii TaxID=96241 RepID=UPI0007726D14|nr:ABC transporter ATP-binding protein [Bacillus spizizenii]KXJ34507.1 ABC transporter ATP-binding protein [Bacillus spizizenii]MCI4168553.1 ABC transporter ATP-binding protein/permease [Bacillus spizizenii]MCY7864140.1 ABC transporter ATP-binding protein/permease [Bacillus spizizenii]MEC2182318.1 ABC transporter ATP-binding protein [Bacillus spizizenii]OUL04658.1 ABC transporter ATP-binding protein [Bacillus spizizenii]